jgi:hypothetical protein
VIVFVCGEPAPFHSSVAAEQVVLHHQKLKLLFVFLQPAKYALAVFILTGEFDVQEVPSYSSVAPVTAGPVTSYHQKLMLLFEFLLLPRPSLAVFIELEVVQVYHHILLLLLF